MDLDINNNLTNEKTKNNDIESFINELDNSLKKDNKFQTVFTSEVYNDIPLASKYEKQLPDIIDKCFEEMSYERDFYYFDYDSKENIYYLDYYIDGEIYRTEYTEDEFKDLKIELGSFWQLNEKSNQLIQTSIKEGLELDVNLKLFDLDREVG